MCIRDRAEGVFQTGVVTKLGFQRLHGGLSALDGWIGLQIHQRPRCDDHVLEGLGGCIHRHPLREHVEF